MKALVYTETRKVEYQDQPDPVRAEGDELISVDAVGICGSDMHAYLGHDPRRVPPLILGHEASGVVVEGSLTGKKVVINPLITCGHCNHCLDGRANLCAERDLIGMYRPGAFAEKIAIPRRNLVEIPADMSSVHAALTEPAATAVHAVNLAARALHRSPGDARALVVGSGSVGLFAALVLADQGVRDLAVAETNPLRRDVAEGLRLCPVFDPQTAPPGESSYDLIIDAVGGRVTREMSVHAAGPGGVVMHIGLLDNDGGIDTRKLTLQEVTLIGTYTYTPVDFRMTLRKLHGGALGDLAWIEQRPLAEGPDAFADLSAGRSAAPKIILRPGE